MPTGVRARRVRTAVCLAIAAIVGLSTSARGSGPALYRATVLPALNERLVFPLAINDRGQIAGVYVKQESRHLFLWDRTRGMQDLGALRGDSRFQQYFQIFLNNLGQIAGTTEAEGIATGMVLGPGPCPFLWDPNVGIELISTPQRTAAVADGITDRGQVVGTLLAGERHIFVWDRTKGMRDLGPGDIEVASSEGKFVVTGSYINPRLVDLSKDANLVGVPIAPLRPFAVNNHGSVVGLSQIVGDDGDAVIWSGGPRARRLRLVDSASYGGCINDANQIIITLCRPDQPGGNLLPGHVDTENRLWDPNRGIISLDRYVPLGPDEIFHAYALNNKGWIVGSVESKRNGPSRIVLLEPNPGN